MAESQFIKIKKPVGFGTSSSKARTVVNNSTGNLKDDVSVIQDTLRQIKAENGGAPGLEVTGKISGPSDPTVKAIKNFQKRQFGWTVGDGVVDPGHVTERKMHEVLAAQLGDKPPPTPPPAGVKFRDVIIAISAKGHRSEYSDLATLDAFVRKRVASEEYANKKDRDLSVIGAFIQDMNNSIDGVVTALNLVSLAEGQKLGKVMMYGISLGGKHIIRVAKSVGGKVPIAYVGVSDGAFFDPDTKTIPQGETDGTLSRSGKATNTPDMNADFAAFAAGTKVNVFQIKGNRFKILNPITGKRMWSSFMFGDEIHGSIPGFTVNRDVSDKCVKTDHTELHGEAARMGEDQMLGDMRSILLSV
jgi:hypothetical protein